MSSDKKPYKKSQLPNQYATGDSGDDGQTGHQGEGIAFRDFTSSTANWRDDTLPYDEMKRLLANHQDLNEMKVKQQKDKRDQYKSLKEGKVPLQAFREGLAAGGARSQFKANPALANKAQFSGIDRQVNVLPTENLAETNQEKRNELQNELRYQLGYQPSPAFNPKPRGPGY